MSTPTAQPLLDEWGEAQPYWTSDKLDIAFAAAMGRDRDDEGRRSNCGRRTSCAASSSTIFCRAGARASFTNAKEDAEGFISLDAGLGEISRHAKDLGMTR